MMSTPTCTSAVRTRAIARLQGRREREQERRRFKVNALAARTATYFLNYGESDDRVTGMTGSRMYAGFRYTLGMTAHT